MEGMWAWGRSAASPNGVFSICALREVAFAPTTLAQCLSALLEVEEGFKEPITATLCSSNFIEGLKQAQEGGCLSAGLSTEPP